MQRRHFMGMTAAAAVAMPVAALAGQELIPYTPEVLKSALSEGKTVFLDYYASW